MKDLLNFVDDHPILSLIMLYMLIDGSIALARVIVKE